MDNKEKLIHIFERELEKATDYNSFVDDKLYFKYKGEQLYIRIYHEELHGNFHDCIKLYIENERGDQCIKRASLKEEENEDLCFKLDIKSVRLSNEFLIDIDKE